MLPENFVPDPDVMYQILMDIARTELKPNEVIVQSMPGAFQNDSVPPTGFSANVTLFRTILSRNRFTILYCQDDVDHVVFDGYITPREDGWLEFSRRPPIVEKLLRMTPWQRWRLKKFLQTRIALESVFGKLASWFVRRPKYMSVRSASAFPGPVDPATGKPVDLRDICPIRVQGYLHRTGWISEKTEETPPGSIIPFRHPSDEYAQIDLPRDSDQPGYDRALREMITRLAEFESRSEAAIVADLIR